MTKYIEENTFNFDNAFGEDSVNEDVYEQVVRPIVYAAFHKAKVTCFAYGQTGSGKTFTMMGDLARKIPGLYLLATQDLFMIRDKSFKEITVFFSIISRPGSPSTRFIARRPMICSTREMDASLELTQKKMCTLSGCPKGKLKAWNP